MRNKEKLLMIYKKNMKKSRKQLMKLIIKLEKFKRIMILKYKALNGVKIAKKNFRKKRKNEYQ